MKLGALLKWGILIKGEVFTMEERCARRGGPGSCINKSEVFHEQFWEAEKVCTKI
jgi:hypothetical protein